MRSNSFRHRPPRVTAPPTRRPRAAEPWVRPKPRHSGHDAPARPAPPIPDEGSIEVLGRSMTDAQDDDEIDIRSRWGVLFQGGLPIMHQGECVGAIGVSGVQSHEDEVIAQAGLNALT